VSLTIPPYIPPVTGAGTLNGQRELSKQVKTIAAASTSLPVVYGEAQVGGRVFAATFTGGFWYLGVAFCVGEIDSYTALYLNGVDVKPATPAGMVINYYTGTTSQTADATLASAISGYVDTLVHSTAAGSVGVAYVVLKYSDAHYSGFPTIVAKVKGRKVRPLSQNLFIRSQELDQTGAWVQAASADIDVTANAAVAPNSTTTADKIIEITTASVTRWIAQSISVSAIPDNTLASASGYFKPAERTAIRFLIRDKTNTYHGFIFDFNTSTVYTSSGSPVDGGISDVGNGWFRVWVVANVGTGAVAPLVRIQMASGATGQTLAYAGVVNSGILAWGIQLEAKASPGVYSATTTAASAAAWSDNPALCARDLIINGAFGLGEDVDDLSALCAANEPCYRLGALGDRLDRYARDVRRGVDLQIRRALDVRARPTCGFVAVYGYRSRVDGVQCHGNGYPLCLAARSDRGRRVCGQSERAKHLWRAGAVCSGQALSRFWIWGCKSSAVL
jgi:hypothetical protein